MLDGILMNWSCDSHGEKVTLMKERPKLCSEGSGFPVSVFQGGGS